MTDADSGLKLGSRDEELWVYRASDQALNDGVDGMRAPRAPARATRALPISPAFATTAAPSKGAANPSPSHRVFVPAAPAGRVDHRVVQRSPMSKIIGVSGSLRAGSFNSMLLRAAVKLAPPGTSIELGTIEGIPLYNYDVEVAGIPPAVTVLRDQIAAADALLLVTPEYNNSIPGVLKNAIDWLSRPPSEIARVFAGRPVGIIGATPGAGGTNLSQTAWLPVLKTLQTHAWFGGRLGVSSASNVFDEAGGLKDEKVRSQLEKYLTGFATFVAAARC